LIPNSTPIRDDLFWNGDFDQVLDLVNSGRILPDEIRFFLGYSGWGEGQLLSEIKEEAWVHIESVTSEDWMPIAKEDFWKNQMVALGGKYLIWSNAPENPMSN
jgi:putative transcriptional regulator